MDVVKAYGSIHIPLQPEIHKKKVRMFSPMDGNTCLEFFGIFKEGGGIHID